MRKLVIILSNKIKNHIEYIHRKLKREEGGGIVF
jgi:hypothetical protein